MHSKMNHKIATKTVAIEKSWQAVTQVFCGFVNNRLDVFHVVQNTWRVAPPAFRETMPAQIKPDQVITCLCKFISEMIVPPGMFSQTVDQMDDTLRPVSRCNPAASKQG